MLFTDPFFLQVFLPVVLTLSIVVLTFARNLLRPMLIIASLYFYACFNPVYLILLLISIAGNYGIAGRMLRDPDRARRLMILGVAANLALLAYYKYLGFFAGLVEAILAPGLPTLQIVLPLGISFFSFTQLAYLVDCQRGKVTAQQHNLMDYCLFVTFFPHLVAGPILHHAQMMPQFDARPSTTERLQLFAEGGVLMAVGLFKKLVIADAIAPTADQIFGMVDAGQAVAPITAWTGTLAYSLQIYFDFSGYSDMAIGLGLMFAIRLPWNFASPYKSANITQFWRTWHMSLSQWLRDYLYIPLGGNRHGTPRRLANLFITMVLGGLWHGAALNFVIWGALHGMYLVAHNLWIMLSGRPKTAAPGETGPASLPGWALTMLGVMVAWVFFRATTTSGAMAMIWAMLGLADGAVVALDPGVVAMIALATALAVLAPGSGQISGWTQVALQGRAGSFALRMVLGLATGGALVAAYVAELRVSTSPFLYFNF